MITHWGTFLKNENYHTCRMFAQRAMQLNNCTVDFGGVDEFLAIGFHNLSNTFISVCSIPLPSGNSWVEVLATSDDSAQAEALRNGIRERIIEASIFDPPPIHPFRTVSLQSAAPESRGVVDRSAMGASSPQTASLSLRGHFGEAFSSKKSVELQQSPTGHVGSSSPRSRKAEVLPPTERKPS